MLQAMGYQASGGTILAQYEYNGGSNAAIVIQVNIPASGVATVSVAQVDSDLDEMADDWERDNFGDLTTAGPATDYDGDGMTDRHEYLAGTWPTNRQSALALDSPALSADGAQVAIPWSSVFRKRYSLLQTPDLLLGFHTFLQTNIPATPPVNVWTTTVPAEPAGMFYRVCLE